MNNMLEGLNDRQLEAVTHVDGPLLIIAGAGSGKTRVLTHRIAYLIEEQDVTPYQIMAITFTNKAAKEMRERVDRIVGMGSESIWVMTFHSTCVRILRRYIDHIGFDNNFTIYDTDDSKNVMKAVFKKLQIDSKNLKEATVLREISRAKDELLGPKEYELANASDYGKKKFVDAYREYQEMLRKNNALDFDDIIRLTVYLFKACPEILENYQNRFRYLMVDEYQDTNTAQFELIRLLASKNRNLCVVGDDDQSIYKFRGANIMNILNFEKVYPDAHVVKLEQNYRSTKTILDAANAVISNNKGRKNKALWTDREENERIRFRSFDNGREEAMEIVSEIAAMEREGLVNYGDCAILYRTNAQSREFEEYLVHRNIPYHLVGGVNFYARKEIKDLLAYLKTVDNGKDDLAVKRIINVPKRGIGASSIAKVQDYADAVNISFFDACCEADQIPGLGKAAEKVRRFSLMIRGYRSALQEDYGIMDLMEQILDDTGYVEELSANDEDDAQDRIDNIDEFLSKIKTYEEEHPENGLSEFLEEVALVSDLDNMDGEVSKVVLMTIHSAKGLEFPNVYISGMEDGVFPGYMTINNGSDEDMEEERRLAYVAITRAMNHLTISYAKARMIRGETQYNPVSRFVKEIPAEYLDGKVPSLKLRDDEQYDESEMPKRFFRENPFSGSKEKFIPRKVNLSPTGNRTGSGTFGNRATGTAKSMSGYGMNGAAKGMTGPGLNSAAKTISGDDSNMQKKDDAIMATLKKGSDFSAGELDYDVGDRVCHVKFGIGTVKKIVPGPRDYQVTVDFEEAGQKIMYAAFAKLVKVTDA
ncbi:MAG: UvrD-helicase domain-containing protein [Lachnospiraceae bacterium]